VSDLMRAIQRDKARLSAHGYDGLYWRAPSPSSEACGCGIGDLRPCGEVNTGCRPARVDDDGMFYPTLIRRKKGGGS
jgi:hypothetical protein